MTAVDRPSIRFFKKQTATIKVADFETALFTFVQKNFGAYEQTYTYGPSSYSAPEKDNQFHESYVRAVYHHIQLADGTEFRCHFTSEESENDRFEKKWYYSFYQFNLEVITSTNWDYFKEIWFLFKPFLEEVGFRDATCQYSYSGTGLYDFYKEQKDEIALAEIIALTEKDILEGFHKEGNRNIEIQHKAFLNIANILEQHPNKKQVRVIQINNNGLTVFPAILVAFPNLERLAIYNNPIKTAFEGLKALKELRSINIHSNPIKDDPIELAKFKASLQPDCHVVCF